MKGSSYARHNNQCRVDNRISNSVGYVRLEMAVWKGMREIDMSGNKDFVQVSNKLVTELNKALLEQRKEIADLKAQLADRPAFKFKPGDVVWKITFGTNKPFRMEIEDCVLDKDGILYRTVKRGPYFKEDLYITREEAQAAVDERNK